MKRSLRIAAMVLFVSASGALYFRSSHADSSQEGNSLSEADIYRRCYGQMVRSIPKSDDPRLLAIKSGTLSAVDACVQLLNLAKIDQSSNYQVAVDNSIGKAIQKTFFVFHSSFFSKKDFGIGGINQDTPEIFDVNEPALFYSHALFDKNAKLSDVLTSQVSYRAVRSVASTPTEVGRSNNVNKRSMNFTYAPDVTNTRETVKPLYQADKLAQCGCSADSDQGKKIIQDLQAEFKANGNVDTYWGPLIQKYYVPIAHWDGVQYLDYGDILGVKPQDPLVIPRTSNYRTIRASQRNFDGKVDISKNMGGGIIGSQAFLMLNTDKRTLNGTNAVSRNWSRLVLGEILCRDIPAIRQYDARPYVDTSANQTFRYSEGCTQCHASIDRMAGAVRNVYLDSTNDFNGNSAGINPPTSVFESDKLFASTAQRDTAKAACFADAKCKAGHDDALKSCQTKCGSDKTCQSACNANAFRYYIDPEKFPMESESKWATQDDPFYNVRKPVGYVYYRSFDGSLIDRRTESLQEMGEFLAQQDDFYVCTAKKYFNFFTGINVSLRDLGDPLQPATLNDRDLYYRNLVIKLGLELKSHQRVDKLIESIISIPEYRQRNYGIAAQ